jgi:hypothetical protein
MTKQWWITGTSFAVLVVAAFWLSDPLPQDPTYHDFADIRNILSIPNFWNAVSNLPFLFVGVVGLWTAYLPRTRIRNKALRLCYGVFFVGVLLTAFGSTYYHLAPSNQTLFWDRLPMTVAFAALFTIVITELMAPTNGPRFLVPFLIIGIGSVFYWRWTESAGMGDLRPYAGVQFLPMLLIPAILWSRRGASTLVHYVWFMIGFYVAAKLFEYYDSAILSVVGVSGHSLKHVCAALAPMVLVLGLRRRSAAQLQAYA